MYNNTVNLPADHRQRYLKGMEGLWICSLEAETLFFGSVRIFHLNFD